jgi:anaerobic selenocysteine-containing dehydrogenase
MDLVVVQDLFLNETARFAHVFLPGTSFLEKDGTFTNAERRINRVRPVFASKVGMDEWEITCAIGRAMGYDMSYAAPSEIMDEIAATTPTFAGVSFARLDASRLDAVAGLRHRPHGTPTMHVGEFVRGKGQLIETVFVPTTERSTAQVPADPHHRPDPQPVQRRRADPAYRQQHVAPRGRPRDPPGRRRDARHLDRRPGRPVSRGSARRPLRARCPSGCRPASSTRPSTTR